MFEIEASKNIISHGKTYHTSKAIHIEMMEEECVWNKCAMYVSSVGEKVPPQQRWQKSVRAVGVLCLLLGGNMILPNKDGGSM